MEIDEAVGITQRSFQRTGQLQVLSLMLRESQHEPVNVKQWIAAFVQRHRERLTAELNSEPAVKS